jgi:hypothetical protein
MLLRLICEVIIKSLDGIYSVQIFQYLWTYAEQGFRDEKIMHAAFLEELLTIYGDTS